MKKVLWVSRHQMTKNQRADLERVMKGKVELLPYTDTVHSAEELGPLIVQADAVAVVLPTDLLAQLMKLVGNKPVMQAISGRVFTGKMVTLSDGRVEHEVAFVHRGWQQILRLELETVML